MSLDVVTLALAKSYTKEHQFTLDFETTSVEKNINDTTDYKLSLIATKRDNSYYASAPYGQLPVDIGYLYMDEITQKLYYSAVKYDRPKYLCDWQTQIGDKNVGSCSDYVAHITYEGDIIFLKNPVNSKDRFTCEDPIIYKYSENGYIASIVSFAAKGGGFAEFTYDHAYVTSSGVYTKSSVETTHKGALVTILPNTDYKLTISSSHNRFIVYGKNGTACTELGRVQTADLGNTDTLTVNSGSYAEIWVQIWYAQTHPKILHSSPKLLPTILTESLCLMKQYSETANHPMELDRLDLL